MKAEPREIDVVRAEMKIKNKHKPSRPKKAIQKERRKQKQNQNKLHFIYEESRRKKLIYLFVF